MTHKDLNLPEVELCGKVKHIIYKGEDHFHVLEIEQNPQSTVKVTGTIAAVKVGDSVKAIGQWIETKYGKEVKAYCLTMAPPMTLIGMEKYLSSRLVKGIGKTTAKRIMDHFGIQALDIIETHPERLFEIPGIGIKRAEAIINEWKKQSTERDTLVFLHSHGLSTSKALQIYAEYGAETIEILRDDPYRLAQDIWGIGFQKADEVAMSVGIKPLSMKRARAGVVYVLEETCAQQGHCYVSRYLLAHRTAELLQIPEELATRAILSNIKEGTLIFNNHPEPDSIFIPSLFKAERSIAERIRELREEVLPWTVADSKKAIEIGERALGLQLSESQRKAVEEAIGLKVGVITGGPGVGKTTIVKAILTILDELGVSFALCAPTGRAAKRLTETSGHPASTIHRLLEVDPVTGDFKHNETNPLSYDLFVIDESSMLDVHLAESLLRSIPNESAVLFVGDVDQLPSVGPGTFLKDLINSESIPVIRLTDVFRQAKSSWIIRVAHQINQGIFPSFPQKGDKGDCVFIEVNSPESMTKYISYLVTEHLPKFNGADSMKDIQVLCPMRNGNSGVKAINTIIQRKLNPVEGESVLLDSLRFSARDKVMQLRNNYKKGVFNGDIGYVERVNPEEKTLLVKYPDIDQSVVYEFGELDELTLSYASTIHKSQGSEFPIVIVPMTTQHRIMLKRKLLYTAVTRGKGLVIVIGQREALSMAIDDTWTEPRNTSLWYWLQNM